MKFGGRWAAWKVWAATGVAVLLLADVLLSVSLWRTMREGPREMAAQRDQLAVTNAQLRADVARGERIRASLAQVGTDCDNFYQHSFLDSHTVYSTVDSDIAAIATKAGVKTTGFVFKETEIRNRNVDELDITTTVDGDYPALLQFVNGIERSKNFYFLNQLQLGSSGPTGIRLQLELHTYFRT